MANGSRFNGEDGLYAVLALAIGGTAALFRQLTIVPIDTVGICAAANAPGFCLPREAVLKLQYLHGFGWVALLLGLAAFILGRRALAALAIGIGVAAVVNYNGTYGVLGVALGLFTWISLKTGRYPSLNQP
ncbi:MAG: hypothetical protein B7Z75_05005 [Acidocella sp. 20-57-95]|nr:MAG: hypothetical protein B7Z75_05005 [Acidocella sp. 20-57-95]HQT64369.1 hypothetical protein [Acidocella sp.]